MTDGHTLIAFLATLAAVVALALFGDRTDLAIMTGLVGVLGTFRPMQRKVEVDQPADKPVPVEPQP